jgi:hypothetical protein
MNVENASVLSQSNNSLVEHHHPIKFVEWLIKIEPNLVKMADIYELYPLHYIVANNACPSNMACEII